MVFDLEDVPAGTSEIVIKIASYKTGRIIGDSASLVGMAAHYKCEPIITD
jgi:hypothetical protein